jgi:hypothetical protein
MPMAALQGSRQSLRCESEWEAGMFHVLRGPDGSLDVRNSGIIANPSN